MSHLAIVKKSMHNYLHDPKKMNLPEGYLIRANSTNKKVLTVKLWRGDNPLAYVVLEFVPFGEKKVMMTLDGGTYPAHRQKGIGTLIRALVTKAALNSGVNNIHHLGLNVENLSAKKLAANEGISLNNAKARNPVPLSTKIVRKLGYAPRNEEFGNHQSYMTPSMSRVKLNNAIKRIKSELNPV